MAFCRRLGAPAVHHVVRSAGASRVHRGAIFRRGNWRGDRMADMASCLRLALGAPMACHPLPIGATCIFRTFPRPAHRAALRTRFRGRAPLAFARLDEARNAGGFSSAARKARRRVSLPALGRVGAGRKYKFHGLTANRLLIGRLISAVPSTLILASGVFIWWIAATCITHDPLFIVHNWPSTWHQDIYGRGTLFSYSQRALEFTGILASPPVCTRSLAQNAGVDLDSSHHLVLSPIFFAHTLPCLRALWRGGLPALYGLGCARNCRAHAGGVEYHHVTDRKMAILCFPRAGVDGSERFARASFLYLDSFPWARDPIAIREMYDWLHEHPEPYKRLVWSNARMCIVAGLTLKVESFATLLQSGNYPRLCCRMRLLARWSFGTIIWPGLVRSHCCDIESIGYKCLRTRRFAARRSGPGCRRHSVVQSRSRAKLAFQAIDGRLACFSDFIQVHPLRKPAMSMSASIAVRVVRTGNSHRRLKEVHTEVTKVTKVFKDSRKRPELDVGQSGQPSYFLCDLGELCVSLAVPGHGISNYSTCRVNRTGA